MPTINGRLVCCSCGSDLGDAEDPYADPACRVCLDRENEAEAEYEANMAASESDQIQEAQQRDEADRDGFQDWPW